MSFYITVKPFLNSLFPIFCFSLKNVHFYLLEKQLKILLLKIKKVYLQIKNLDFIHFFAIIESNLKKINSGINKINLSV